MRRIDKSNKLDQVCYDIRGPVLDEAMRLEEEGHRVIKLNIGNPASFGLFAPEEIIKDVIHNLPESQGYCDSKGLFSARKAVMQHYQQQGMLSVGIDDIYIGNGVSELIVMAMQALINNGDEILIPSPDYPLWTAAVTLSGGNAAHYRCNEDTDWFPDVEDMRRKISPRTRGIVLINPNNPTGAVYDDALIESVLELAREHDLIVFSDEIYDKVLFGDVKHTPTATLASDLLIVTFNGLSKAYRAAGFRSGWMMISGAKHSAKGYISGLDMLASMRLCANVPMQHAIQTALGGYQSVNELLQPGGRLYDQMDYAWRRLNAMEGVSCKRPKGAMYLFAKLDQERFNIKDDQQFALDLLMQEKVLIVQGTGFNWPEPNHFRIVFLPRIEELEIALDRLERFLSSYRQ